jgi:hypothetical protein
MADVIDMAQEFDALNLKQGLQAQLLAAQNAPKLSPQGYCLSPICMDEFEEGSNKLFCGPVCARDHHQFTTNR